MDQVSERRVFSLNVLKCLMLGQVALKRRAVVQVPDGLLVVHDKAVRKYPGHVLGRDRSAPGADAVDQASERRV